MAEWWNGLWPFLGFAGLVIGVVASATVCVSSLKDVTVLNGLGLAMMIACGCGLIYTIMKVER